LFSRFFSAFYAVNMCEPDRVQTGQGTVFEFRQFPGGAVNLDANGVGQREQRRQHRSDVGNMFQYAIGSEIGFAAINDVVVDEEVEVGALFLGSHRVDDGRESGFEGVELAGFDLEVGVDADDVGHGDRFLS